MAKSVIDTKWDTIRSFLHGVIKEPQKYPDELAVFVLTDEELHQVFTKERLRILGVLRERTFESVTELSDKLRRDKAAVDRDLKLLEGYGLVKMLKEGRKVKLELGKEGVYLPLVEPKPIEELIVREKSKKYSK